MKKGNQEAFGMDLQAYNERNAIFESWRNYHFLQIGGENDYRNLYNHAK